MESFLEKYWDSRAFSSDFPEGDALFRTPARNGLQQAAVFLIEQSLGASGVLPSRYLVCSKAVCRKSCLRKEIPPPETVWLAGVITTLLTPGRKSPLIYPYRGIGRVMRSGILLALRYRRACGKGCQGEKQKNEKRAGSGMAV